MPAQPHTRAYLTYSIMCISYYILLDDSALSPACESALNKVAQTISVNMPEMLKLSCEIAQEYFSSLNPRSAPPEGDTAAFSSSELSVEPGNKNGNFQPQQAMVSGSGTGVASETSWEQGLRAERNSVGRYIESALDKLVAVVHVTQKNLVLDMQAGLLSQFGKQFGIFCLS